MGKLTPFENRMYSVIADLSDGEVVSFGDVAGRAGRPNASRAAGRLLSKIRATELPWWRVVYSDGRLPKCNPKLQTTHLESEGVTVTDQKVTVAPMGRFER
jgi:methylated-DNA-protein-cysteine methyltransferase-like protein